MMEISAHDAHMYDFENGTGLNVKLVGITANKLTTLQEI